MKKHILLFTFILSTVAIFAQEFWISAGNQGIDCPETVQDVEGNTYTTVLIGNQCWMAVNINIGDRIDGVNEQSDNETIEKYCYDDLESNCDIYGGLYQWKEMMQYVTTEATQGICPTGWHLPSDEEWKHLEGEVDSNFGYPDPEWNGTAFRGFDAGIHLKSISGWASSGNGDYAFGFTALPSGYRYTIGGFMHLGSIAYFWSSSGYSISNAWGRNLFYSNEDVHRGNNYETHGRSVRCLQD